MKQRGASHLYDYQQIIMLNKMQPIDNETKVQYRSLLIRLWREKEETNWRFLVEDVSTGQQQHFATIEYLFDFLQQQVEAE
jgi:hypothetical protein